VQYHFHIYYPSAYSAKVVYDPATNASRGFGFVYFKDENVSSGADAGWIDELAITPITTPPVVTATTKKAFAGVSFSYQIL